VEKHRIRVLIAYNNESSSNIIKENIEAEGDMEVVAMTTNGEETLKKILELAPDVALVDLVMPVNDGLWILEELEEAKFTQTGVIAMSSFENDTVSHLAIDLGAKYFLVKPFSCICLKRRITQVYNDMRVKEIKINDYESSVHEWPISKRVEINEIDEDNTEYIVSDVIIRLGIAPSLKGYYYIRSSVIMILNEEDTVMGITKRIYPDVAKEYKTSAGKVERDMRHAIDLSWKKDEGLGYEKVFGCSFHKKPTNGQMLANIAEYVKLRGLKKVM
jgi:Response regulator containing a CheY-like receiver domain and an HTH DNA-binding domain